MKTDKPNLRKQYLQKRKAVSSFDSFIRSWTIQGNLIDSDFYSSSSVIGLYYPILNEVQTFRILNHALMTSKTVCFPALVDDRLNFYEYRSNKELRMGKYNIMEPNVTHGVMNNQLDLVIVPGIVFDIVGNRIGYGKGYYDKFLASISSSKLTIVGLGYTFQVHPEEFDHCEHDAKMDFLITEIEAKCFHC